MVHDTVNRSKRDAILDAALDLFCEQTFDGTPVPLIAERAGVGAGTIYRYFASKEELANAVFQRAKGALLRALGEALPEDATYREQFGLLWRRLTGFVVANPAAFRFLETQQHDRYLDAASRQVSDDVTSTARAWVRRAQAAGAVRAVDAGLLISFVWGAVVGLAKMHFEALTDRKLAAAAEAVAWDAIRA